MFIYISCLQDSQPRGSIELLPGTWCGAVTQGTPKLPDAQLASHGGKDSAGVVSVVRMSGAILRSVACYTWLYF